jgi:hypothetical protein
LNNEAACFTVTSYVPSSHTGLLSSHIIVCLWTSASGNWRHKTTGVISGEKGESEAYIPVSSTLANSNQFSHIQLKSEVRACTDQLAGVFTDIFNLSLSQSAVPTCFKMASIVPVPKNVKVAELNYYRPVALTSVIMKCFERLVKDHITSTLPVTLDPLQFAYHPPRSTDIAIAITLHTALSHLDKRHTC